MKKHLVFEIVGGIVQEVYFCEDEVHQERTFNDCVRALGVEPWAEMGGVYMGEDVTVQLFTA